MNRREYLAIASVSATGCLAGCSGALENVGNGLEFEVVENELSGDIEATDAEKDGGNGLAGIKFVLSNSAENDLRVQLKTEFLDDDVLVGTDDFGMGNTVPPDQDIQSEEYFPGEEDEFNRVEMTIHDGSLF